MHWLARFGTLRQVFQPRDSERRESEWVKAGVDRLRHHVRTIRLGVSFLLIAAAAYQVVRQNEAARLGGKNFPAQIGELSCTEVHRISTWSEERYGGRSGLTLHSPEFGAHVAHEVAKRLDPTKLLLLQSEVDGFAKRADAPWARFVKSRDCAYFDHWIFEQRQRLKESFRARLAPILAKLPVIEGKSDEANDGWDTPPEVHGEFAQAEAELNERLEKYARQLNEQASPALLGAYGGDRRRLVAGVIEQALLGDAAMTRLSFAKGILGAMDPYSTYFSSDEFDDFYSDLAGGVTGIGVKVRRVPRGYLVESLIPESPAAKSGKVGGGDIVVAIDGKRLTELDDRAAKKLFKGVPQSVVRLTVEKPKSGATQVISLMRRHFDFQESRVTGRVVRPSGQTTGGIGVIEVPSFYGRGGMGDDDERSSAEDFEQALRQILNNDRPVDGIVLDLRGNPGGYLEEAVSMAGLFIADAPVVAVVGQDSQRVLRDDKDTAVYGGPLVVLVDSDSASASEVLAGALKDHQRAMLVGTPRTYGKGSVQKLFHLGDEFLGAQWAGLPASGVVKLTTSVFYSPLGHTPANGGVQTHITLAQATPSTAPLVKVQDLEPFVDASALTRIDQKRQVMEQHVNEIRTSRERPASAKFSPGEEAKRIPVDSPRTVELNQAVDIVSELAKIEAREATESRSAVSRKP